jgi:hypothetical protein
VTTRVVRAVLLTALALGCGGSGASQPTGTTEAHEVTSGQTPTRFQRAQLLGHYSTFDGKSGVIIDRRGDVVKAKLDGSSGVKIMKPNGGPHGSTEYRSDDGSIWFRIDEGGDVRLFQGPSQKQGVEVIRDADAEPLE